VEFSIPLSNLAVTFDLDIAVWVVNTTDSVAVVPSTSFLDGPDPDLATYFRFHPRVDVAPADYTPVP
jgi:hypothetical protein